jgi:diguanylate cyclase (GGDEF)-like protein
MFEEPPEHATVPRSAWDKVLRSFGDADRFDDFGEYARHATTVYGKVACLSGPVLLAIWWFTDRLVYADAAAAKTLLVWRVILIGVGLGAFAVTWLLGKTGRSAVPVLVCSYVFMCGFSYHQFGKIGGVGTPWIHTASLMPLPSFLLLLDLKPRAMLVAAIVLIAPVAYYGPHPEYLDDPYLWSAIAMLVTSGIVSVAFGHLLYRLSQRDFDRGRDLKRLAMFDSLTGAYRRGRWFERCDTELMRARRFQRPLAVLMVDVDGFKRINDSQGHLAGDVMLAGIADTLRGTLRENDVLGRFGGDEFAVLLPETGMEKARTTAERLRSAVAEQVFEGAVTVTLSIGCSRNLEGDDTHKDLIARADKALYAAKKAGRNRVAVSDA